MQKSSYRNSHKSMNYGRKYNRIYQKDSYNARVWILEKKILELIFQKYIKTKIHHYLDFACGTGRLLEVFENKATVSFGIDISEEMLKEAKKKFKKTIFIKDDLTKNQNLFQYKFDVITLFRFFLNAEESLRKNILMLIYRILKKEGFLILNNHGNKNSIRSLPVYLRNLFNFKKLSILSYLEMKKLLDENNFKIIEIYGLSFLPQIFSKILPIQVWIRLERFIMNLKSFKLFGTHLIFVCRKIF